jgi:HK97 family phage prohead protease
METIKYKDIQEKITSREIDKNTMTITHYISTSTPDRYGEIMKPDGCDYSGYRKNPVVFFGHRSRDLPVAKNEKIIIENSGVLAVTKFDTSDFAREIFRLNKEGFLNSWSIGFVPKKFSNQKLKLNDNEQNYLCIEEWELLEYSSVPIPANPDAVNLMLKELKSEKIKEIIEQENFKSRIRTLKTNMEILKSGVTERLREDSKNTEEIIKRELKYFEDRLVRTLLRLKMK